MAAVKPRLVPSVEEQTGWIRTMPHTVCQSMPVLLKITQRDYDLSDPFFRKYVREHRGYIYPGDRKDPTVETRSWRVYENPRDNKDLFYKLFRFAQEYPPGSGFSREYTDDELETHWEIVRANKGSLQDCWELYQYTVQDWER